MTRYSAIIALLIAAVTAGAAPRVVTLDECRQLALENNAKVKLADNKARAAEEVRRQAFTDYFPTVAASGLAFWSNKDVFQYNVLDLFTIGLIKKGVGASVTAVQPVFAGGRIVNGNKLASVGVEAGRIESENVRDDIAVTAEQYYWQLVTLKSKKRTLTEFISMVDTLCRQVHVAVDAGVVLRNDLLKAELRRNELQSLMVDLDNGIALSSKLLAQFIGMDGQAIDVPDSELDPSQMPPMPQGIYVEPDAALPSTADYRLLQAQVKAADLQKRMAIGENMPMVGVGAGYFYDDLLSQKHSFGALFVSVAVPISGWWSGSHAIKKSKLEAESAHTQLDDLSQMLKLAMTNAWDDLTAAHRKMAIAAESIAQSAENLRINRDYYRAGVSTITELLDAQTLYRQSLDQYTEAYGNFMTCRARYLDATGRARL